MARINSVSKKNYLNLFLIRYHNGGMHHHHGSGMGGGFVPTGPSMGMSGVGMGMSSLGLSGHGTLGLGSASSLGIPGHNIPNMSVSYFSWLQIACVKICSYGTQLAE